MHRLASARPFLRFRALQNICRPLSANFAPVDDFCSNDFDDCFADCCEFEIPPSHSHLFAHNIDQGYLEGGVGSFFRSCLQRVVLFFARRLGLFDSSPSLDRPHRADVDAVAEPMEHFALTENLPQPVHVGIILDGNRRYARNFLTGDPWDGHESGTRTVEELVDWAVDDFPFLETLTLYSFSTENFNRSPLEREFLLQLFSCEIAALLDRMDEVVEKGVKLHFMGRLDAFDEYDPELRSKMHLAEELTSECENITVNFAMAYGGQAEIVDATKKIIDIICECEDEDEVASFVDELDETRFRDFLYLADSPDLIIRTGGRFRVSNFLLYQCAYSEWFFLEKLWPEFTKEDLAGILMDFQHRNITKGE